MKLRLGLLFAATLPLASAAPLREPPTPIEVITQINIARTSPTTYADLLRSTRTNFRGNVYRDRDRPDGLITVEGVAAADEAIDYLSGHVAVAPVQPSDLLNAAARAHVLEQGPIGGTSHISIDGSSPGARVKKLGGDIFVAETITYGSSAAEAVVRQLIIDDGVRGRGHRRILFSAEYLYAGAACGPHKIYGTMCVVDFSHTANGAP